MTSLTIHRSHRLEILADRLARTLRVPMGGVFDEEIVVVPSRGMARWLDFALAERNGACANVQFPFPASFLQRVVDGFFPGAASPFQMDTDSLRWRIFHRLGQPLDGKYSEVRAYLLDGDALKRFQLAGRLAELFSRYAVFRPQWMKSWSTGDGADAWQMDLWHGVSGEVESNWPDALLKAMQSAPSTPLPERVSLFGVGVLPPVLTELFAALSRHTALSLYLIEPTRAYFGSDGAGRRRKDPAQSEAHPLVASMGLLAAEFTDVLIDAAEIHAWHGVVEEERAERGERDTLLHALQEDIVEGVPVEESFEAEEGDRSIQIHSCHSPARELEVLRNVLLESFELLPGLRPRDVLVLCPDLEIYAPLVASIFDETPAIPYSLAERSMRGDVPALAAFSALLDLPGSRAGAPTLFEMLEREPVRRRFGFSEDDLDQMRAWMWESGIRWGLDAEHRRRWGINSNDFNTWERGLKRMLLGVAMGGGEFEGCTPIEGVEGSRCELLGRFLAAVEPLQRLVVADAPRSLEEWKEVLMGAAEVLLPDETPEDLAALSGLRVMLGQMVAREAGEMEKRDVEWPVVRAAVGEALDMGVPVKGFLGGGVTFCTLRPMRSIPARVICLLGMNEGEFPRKTSAPSFDLLAAKRKRGDSSPKDDERHLFLEVLGAVRERLVISYVGQSLRDNKPVPRAAIVSELIDALERTVIFPDGKSAADVLVTQHRLHGFNASYFDGGVPDLFSFSESDVKTARSLQHAARKESPFIVGEPPAAEVPESVTCADLERFFAQPSEFYLRASLGMDVRGPDESSPEKLDDTEPLLTGGLEKYALNQDLVDAALRGGGRSIRTYVERALLPQDQVGVITHEMLREEAERFALRVKNILGAPADVGFVVVRPLSSPLEMVGSVGRLFENGLGHYRMAKVKPKDWIVAWLRHLAAGDRETCLVALDGAWRFGVQPNRDVLLGDLLEVFKQGHARPLPLFPRASWEYAQADPEKAPGKAQAAWSGGYNIEGECYHPAHELLWPDADLNEEFGALATRVFAPLLAAREEVG